MKLSATVELMKVHRSVRAYSRREVDEATLKSIISAAQCAATSHFVQAYSVIRVQDREKRAAIADIAGSQKWVKTAPVFLIFCADFNRLETVGNQYGVPVEKGWAEQLIVATVDAALLAQNVMLAAESLGLGGVFIGGIRNDPGAVCDLLAIPEQVYPVFGMCMGWPAKPLLQQDPAAQFSSSRDQEIKPRLPVEAVFFDDSYPEKHDPDLLADYDRRVKHYYLHRESNMRDETWTGQMAEFMGRIVRPHMKNFLMSRGFFHK